MGVKDIAFPNLNIYLENVPKRFEIFGIEIALYGVIIGVGMLLSLLLISWVAKKSGQNSDFYWDMALVTIITGVVGARLYYVVFSWDSYKDDLLSIINLRQGGLAIYGGVIGGVLGIIIFALIKKDFKLLIKLMDVCAPCLILGQALGRWGNFFNQEAYGNLVTNTKLQWFPYAVYIENEAAWFQATFFYESLWNFVGLAILLLVFKKSENLGTTTASYLVWYGIGRTIIEGLRSDSLYIGTTNIRVSQLLSMILVFVGVGILVFNYIKKKRKVNG